MSFKISLTVYAKKKAAVSGLMLYSSNLSETNGIISFLIILASERNFSLSITLEIISPIILLE